MKRIGTVFLALALLAMVLAGCAPAAEEAPATEAPATEAPATEAPATEAPAEEVTIRVGAMTGPTGIGMVKLLEAGMDDSGLVRYEPTIAGSADRDHAAANPGGTGYRRGTIQFGGGAV